MIRLDMRSHGDTDFYCGPQGYDTVQSGSCVGASVPEQNADPNFRASSQLWLLKNLRFA
jgi:hypothetical protein